jgi:hypothetical protein
MKANLDFSYQSTPGTVNELIKLNRGKKIQLGAIAKQALTNIVRLLTGDSEIRIWQRCDRAGNIVWYVYNPATEQSAQFSSEQEVRVWLDQHYYE